MARDIGGTGFTSLSDYLGANQQPLNAQYNADSSSAHGIGDTFNQSIGLVEPSAYKQAYATGTPGQPGDVAGYTDALNAGEKAQELGRKFGSQAGLAGQGANPVSGEQSFNAALEYGAHGGDYKSLSGYLGGFTPGAADAAYAKGAAQGAADYKPNGYVIASGGAPAPSPGMERKSGPGTPTPPNYWGPGAPGWMPGKKQPAPQQPPAYWGPGAPGWMPGKPAPTPKPPGTPTPPQPKGHK